MQCSARDVFCDDSCKQDDTIAHLYEASDAKAASFGVQAKFTSAATMAEQFQPKSVKDVPKDLFIKAYAEHLKANDKVRVPFVLA